MPCLLQGGQICIPKEMEMWIVYRQFTFPSSFVSVAPSHSWLECSPCIRKVVCLNPSRDRSKIVKTGSDSSTAKRSELGVSVKNPRKCQVTQYLWLKNLTAQRPNVPSKVKTLQLFTGNNDVSK